MSSSSHERRHAIEVGRKRSASEANIYNTETVLSPGSHSRMQLTGPTGAKIDHKTPHPSGKSTERWITHGLTEDYVNIVGELMYPKTLFGPYGFSSSEGRFPLERITALGYLMSPLRRQSVVEKWSPLEVALFEAALTLYGKEFHTVQKYVKTKTTKEIIEFYYDWKKTSHYKEWKKVHISSEQREVPSVEAD